MASVRSLDVSGFTGNPLGYIRGVCVWVQNAVLSRAAGVNQDHDNDWHEKGMAQWEKGSHLLVASVEVCKYLG